MNGPRLASTKTAAKTLGFVDEAGEPNTRAFLAWAKQQKGLPRPNGKHHLWWDMKAIDQYLDKQSEIQPESAVNYDALVRERLAKHGGIQSEIRR